MTKRDFIARLTALLRVQQETLGPGITFWHCEGFSIFARTLSDGLVLSFSPHNDSRLAGWTLRRDVDPARDSPEQLLVSIDAMLAVLMPARRQAMEDDATIDIEELCGP